MLGLLYCVILLSLYNSFVASYYRVVLLKWKTLTLGTQTVSEITLLEWKPLFSLKFFYFYPGDYQEIYHTHSFSSYSFRLFGNYMEAFIDPISGRTWEEPRNRSRLIFIPRDRFHQITKSNGCATLMLTGPWSHSYQEYEPIKREIIISTHGRRIVDRRQI